MIVTALVAVLLAILVVANLRNTTSVSLVGATIDNVPTVSVMLVSFAGGVVFSLLLVLTARLRRRRRNAARKGRDGGPQDDGAQAPSVSGDSPPDTGSG
jgi:uncharacterized integral membrane protein